MFLFWVVCLFGWVVDGMFIEGFDNEGWVWRFWDWCFFKVVDMNGVLVMIVFIWFVVVGNWDDVVNCDDLLFMVNYFYFMWMVKFWCYVRGIDWVVGCFKSGKKNGVLY